MTNPICIIHFADFHMGVDAYGPLDPDTKLNGRVLDFLDALDALIDYAEDNDVDLALFAGDAFHRHSPTPTYAREFGKRIVRLSDQCPIVLLVGNHDVSGGVNRASAIDIYKTLRVPNVIIGDKYEIHDIKTKRGLVQVATFPFPEKSVFMPDKGGVDERYEKYCNNVANMTYILAGDVDINYPSIFLGHISVNTAAYGSEVAMTVGNDAEVHIRDLLYPWDYVALGHIHYHQELGIVLDKDNPPIVYAGSLERIDFGEEKDKKGFVWVEIDEVAEWEFIEIDARPFVTIRVDATDTRHVTDKVIGVIDKLDLTDAVIRLIVDMDGRHLWSQEVIHNIIMDKGAYYIYSTSVNITRVQRTRLDLGKPISSFTEQELLETYFKSVNIVGKKQDKIIDMAFEIMDDVDYDRA